MIKKTLIIAPHPDDEINLAGQLIISLLKKSIEVFVVYTTNGDSDPKIGNKRIIEAVNANAILGIDSDHLFFLGYANEWFGDIHIYNAPDNEILMSKIGKTETNSVKEYPEFCFKRHGHHNSFSRINFKNDFKELVLFIMPDLIISPEFDSHPDHRATSLFFDEIMGEILKLNKMYKPIVLKKYIHEGVWYGPKDYYQKPMQPTFTNGKRKYSGGLHDLDSPNFRWTDRIRFETDAETKTPLLKNNIVFKAASKHKVTTSWYEMQRVINADIVYWNRPTNNLALDAQVTVSSGNAGFINDFLQYGSDDILEIEEPFKGENKFCWYPEESDKVKKICLKFQKSHIISRVIIFEDCSVENHIYKLKVSTNTYSDDIELNNDGTGSIIYFPNIKTDVLYFEVIKSKGKPGIAEIEVYSELNNTDSVIPIKNYEKCEEERGAISFSQKIEKILFMLCFLFKFKLKYEIKRILQKKRKNNGLSTKRR